MLSLKKKYLLTSMILAISPISMAKELRYDHIETTYTLSTIEVDTLGGSQDLDARGVSFAGSKSITPALALTASYNVTDVEELNGVKIDTSEVSLGITAHTSITPSTDVFGNASIFKTNVEVDSPFLSYDEDDTGNAINIGLRFLATDKVELETSITRVDVFDETENSFAAGTRFYANEKFSLGLGYAKSDDAYSILFNARIDL